MSELENELRRWTIDAVAQVNLVSSLRMGSDEWYRTVIGVGLTERLERLLRQTLYQNATSPVVDSLRLGEPIIHHASNSFTAAILAALKDENDG